MNKTLFPALVFAASLGLVLNLRAQTQAPADSTAPAAGRTAPTDAFTPVSKSLAGGELLEARALLQTMQQKGLAPDQFSRWENLAARVAVRLGDAKWLAQINRDGGNGTSADELLTISALRLVLSNRLEEAQKLLNSIKDPEAMSEIPRRRFDQLQLKIAQLQGDKPREQKWAGKLVEFVAQWDSPTCQSCHANPKASGKDITSLDLDKWWVGARYVELLRESKGAEKVVEEARLALGRNAKDEAATIRLAYALRASGDEAGAQKTLREVPWTKWPDRDFKKPLRFGVFP